MRSADCGPCCATSEVRRARNWSASRRSCCAPPRKSGRGAEEPLTLHRRRGPRYRVPRSRLPPEEGPGPTPGVDRPRALQTVPRLPPRVRPRCAHRRRWSRVRRPGALQRLRALWALRRSMPVWGYLHADREDARRSASITVRPRPPTAAAELSAHRGPLRFRPCQREPRSCPGFHARCRAMQRHLHHRRGRALHRHLG